MLFDISIFISSKKLVLYKFFKILFNVCSEKSSFKSISPNSIIVSLDILSLPETLIFLIVSAKTEFKNNNKKKRVKKNFLNIAVSYT